MTVWTSGGFLGCILHHFLSVPHPACQNFTLHPLSFCSRKFSFFLRTLTEIYIYSVKVCNCFFSLRNIYNCIEEINARNCVYTCTFACTIRLPTYEWFFLSKSQNLAKAKPPKSITPTGLSTVQYVSSIYNKNIYSIHPNPSKGEEQKIWSSVMYSISRIKKVSYTYLLYLCAGTGNRGLVTALELLFIPILQ